jgi:hypothetical protein
VVRLTVVTLFGLIGTITTGFLGMNLLAEADAPLWRKALWFGVVFVATTWLTIYTMVKSQRLSDFFDALSNDRLGFRGKMAALARVWRSGAISADNQGKPMLSGRGHARCAFADSERRNSPTRRARRSLSIGAINHFMQRLQP